MRVDFLRSTDWLTIPGVRIEWEGLDGMKYSCGGIYVDVFGSYILDWLR